MFHQYAPDSIDTPPQLQGLYGLSIAPLIPFLVGGASVAGTLLAWEGKPSWSVGEYNNYMRQMSDTIKEWDTLGWDAGCWKKSPAKRTAWKAFWTRFSKHYKEWPNFPTGKWTTPVGGLPPGAEMPTRSLMKELAAWGAWLNKTCQAGTVAPTPLPDPTPDNGGGTSTDVATMVKWGAIGIGAIVLLNVVQGVRGAFPRRP
jgi:hypothetical protein